MKVSYNWLKEYLNLNVPADQLGEKIERTAVEVDSVTKHQDGLKKLVVGKVVSCEKHPNSDHLHVCQVDVNQDDLLQIVCGAPNVAAGEKVIVALPGSRIGNNVKIKRAKMRGVKSNGMLCGLDEVGFDRSVVPEKWLNGIYVFPDDAKVGKPIYHYLGMDDDLIDLDVTPNRGDMLSIYGTVHELAAIYDLKPDLNHPKVEENPKLNASDDISADVDKKIAPIYKLRVLKNVKIQPSPLWMQIRLWNADIRPVNNVVDITNYIMLKYGQPIQVYDLDKINNQKLLVRNARLNEKVETTDGDKVTLTDDDIVVADDQKPVALAGLTGLKGAEVDQNTKNIIFEAGVFSFVKVRKMAQRHSIHTGSSQRFERGVNHAGVNEALDAACEIEHRFTDADIEQGTVTASDIDAKPVNVDITLTRINRVLGLSLTMPEASNIFKRLGFGVEINDDQMSVSIPPRRWDIHIEADLFEEIARIYGYDNMPSTLPSGPTTIGKLTNKQKLIRRSRRILQDSGLTHAISYSLTTAKKANMFMMRKSYETKLKMPMTIDRSTLRMNLLSGLLDDVAYNQARGVDDVALYELGRVFYKDDEKQVRPNEVEHIAGVISGSLSIDTWNHKSKPVDFYQLKGIVDNYLDDLNLNGDIDYEATSDYPEMHPGRTANIYIHGHKIGFIGQIHPVIADKFNIKPTYAFELDLKTLIEMPKREQTADSVSKYPSISRDIAILVDKNVTNKEIVSAIQKRGGAFLNQVHLFDLYDGAHIPSGKKSMAYTLTYQDQHDTLQNEVVDKSMKKIQRDLKQQFNVTIR
ncbi:phenylalanine--tRNA ligase beta subunit [Philodulcilactobacillus myokoensis]|uniref:Phenylalanine--tRNA ligase beta subunit n=1 Tax=Philodulcilactobacillus myokoensis TaxID=2929573 RepID=A0A9W6B0K5_9LACO|nr:phenylalanine--tRNA ligase subunit beta [Philodulcilactobacillus myokoensis]GLB46774.1 phenylalanine--tRNA ligase beta subunit [Philodulcilactobacillus myokoensis]